MDHGSVITISLAAVDHNAKALKRLVGPDVGVCAVVKANAYGLGAVRIARQLIASGVNMLAVFGPEEAAELINAGIGAPVLVLMPVWEITRTDELYRALVRGNVHLTVHNLDHLDQLQRIAERYATRLPLHVELDTGMSRGGCGEDEAGQILERVAKHRLMRLAGVFAHFAGARDNKKLTEKQRDRFEAFIEANRHFVPDDCRLHIANTAGSLRGGAFHKSMIRVGIGWAGYGTELLSEGDCVLKAGDLQPAIRWTSRIVLTKEIAKGTHVGYGGAWTAKRKTRLGLLPIGYADGFPMALKGTDASPSEARVGIMYSEDERTPCSFAPVVGALSMDQITIDITDAPHARVGTPVELIGTDRDSPNYLVKVAQAAGVIPHVILAGLSPAIPRQFLPPSPAVETVVQTAAERAGREVAALARE